MDREQSIPSFLNFKFRSHRHIRIYTHYPVKNVLFMPFLTIILPIPSILKAS